MSAREEASARRLAQAEAGFGGTWIEALRGAWSVHRVQDVTKQALDALLGRRIDVYMAPDETHLVSAKEIAAALISLSVAHPEAELRSVQFHEFDARNADKAAFTSLDGTEIHFNLQTFHARNRFGFMRAAADEHYGPAGLVTLLPAGSALNAVHEWGHVLAGTASRKVSSSAADGPKSLMDRPNWTAPGALPDSPESLWQELDRIGQGTPEDAFTALPQGDTGVPRASDVQSLEDAKDDLEFHFAWGNFRQHIASQVTLYATADTHELIAEGFTSVTSGRWASKIFRATHGRLMRALGRSADYSAKDLIRNIAAVREGIPLDAVLGFDSVPGIDKKAAVEMRAAWERAVEEDGRERWTAPTPAQRFAQAEARLPQGDWQRAMHDAPDVKTVEKLTRGLMQASFGAPVLVDMAAEQGTHLLSAKEAGAALVTLAHENARARLNSVRFRRIAGRDVLGETQRTADGGSCIDLNIDYLTETGRPDLTDHLMRDWNGGKGALPPSVGAAAGAVREFGNVLSNTADQGLRDRAAWARELPEPAWGQPKTVDRTPDLPAGFGRVRKDRGLAFELAKTVGFEGLRKRIAQMKDYTTGVFGNLAAKLGHSSRQAEQTPLNNGFGVRDVKTKDQVSRAALERPQQLIADAFARTTFFRDVDAVHRATYGRLMRALGDTRDKGGSNLRSAVAAVTAGTDDNTRIGLAHWLPGGQPETSTSYLRFWRSVVADEPVAPDIPGAESKKHAYIRARNRHAMSSSSKRDPSEHAAFGRLTGQSPGRRKGHALDRKKG